MRTYFYLVTYDPDCDDRPTIDVSDRPTGITRKIIETFNRSIGGPLISSEIISGLTSGTPSRYEHGSRRGLAFAQEALPSPGALAAALGCDRDRVADLHGRIQAVTRPREIVVNGRVLDSSQAAELTRVVRMRLRRSIEERMTSAVYVQIGLLESCIDGRPDLFEAELIEVGRRILADWGEKGPSTAT